MWSTIRLACVALAFMCPAQEQEEDPHANQPASCNNFRETAPEHKCACGKAMHSDCDKEAPSVMNDTKCKTTCHPDRCRCVNKCTT